MLGPWVIGRLPRPQLTLLWLASHEPHIRNLSCSLSVFSGFSQDSLAAEIEGTMRKELQLEEPESPDIAYGLVLSFPEAARAPCSTG